MSHDLIADTTVGSPRSTVLETCPLNHGRAVVDQLLTTILPAGSIEAIDAALDFRLLLADPLDPAAVLRGFFGLRGAADEHLYLAYFRLQRWLESRFVAVVQVDRSSRPLLVGLDLRVASFGALYAQCAIAATAARPAQAWTRVQFALARLAPVPAGIQPPLPIR